MKVVMTLLCRDEADIVDAQVAFHLNIGVDFVIATDNRSVDETTEILESYERAGYLHLIREPGEDKRQREWVTRMARLAATEFGADWVINSDADEFWLPSGGSFKDVLGAIPRRYGLVSALVRAFVPRPDDESFFAERMVVRLSPRAPINDPTRQYRPGSKVVHRGDPTVTVSSGNMRASGDSLVPLRGWCPVEQLHFPIRSIAQCERKFTTAHRVWAGTDERTRHAYYDKPYEALRAGRIAEYYASLALDDDELERGVREGSIVVDTRLRDALRSLRAESSPDAGARRFRVPSELTAPLSLPRPTLVDEAAYAVDVAVLDEAEAVKLQRYIDTLEARLATLERRVGPRVTRMIARAVRRGRAPLRT